MPEQKEKKLTGYPSIDKPWLKYYSEEAINAPLRERTIYQFFWESSKNHLSDIGFDYYGTKISYGQMFDLILQAAAAFKALGVADGDMVTIMSMQTPESIACVYALNYIGATANLVYMTLSAEEILETMQNTKSKALVILDSALEKLAAIRADISVPVVVLGAADSMPMALKLAMRLKTRPISHSDLTWKNFLILAKKSGAGHPAQDSKNAAIVVYTSGSTGKPKGVMLSSDNLNAIPMQVRWTDRNYHRGETLLFIMPIFFGFGIGMLHHCSCMGLRIFLRIATDGDTIGKLYNRIKPNRFVGGPPLLEGIMKHTKGDLSRCIEFTGGGEKISPDKENEFNCFLKDHHSPMRYIPGYGMTEFCSTVTSNMFKAYKQGSVGIPMVSTNVKVVDTDTGTELPYNQTGELCFCCPNTMIGYYKDQEATKKAIEIDADGNRWMHTEDLGYVDEDGFVFIVGRIKRIYVVRSATGDYFKIYPQMIENIILHDPVVEYCGTVVVSDKQRVNIPIVFVSLRDHTIDKKAVLCRLYELVKKELPEYDQPREVEILDRMPMTQSGKIDYQILEKMAREHTHNPQG